MSLEARTVPPHVIPELVAIIQMGHDPIDTSMSLQSQEIANNLFNPRFNVRKFVKPYSRGAERREITKPERNIAIGIIVALTSLRLSEEAQGSLRLGEHDVLNPSLMHRIINPYRKKKKSQSVKNPERLMTKGNYAKAKTVPEAVSMRATLEIGGTLSAIKKLRRKHPLRIMLNNYWKLIPYSDALKDLPLRVPPLLHIHAGLDTQASLEKDFIQLISIMTKENSITKGEFVELYRNSSHILQLLSGKHLTTFNQILAKLQGSGKHALPFDSENFKMQDQKVIFSKHGLQSINAVRAEEEKNLVTTRCPARNDVDSQTFIEVTHSRIAGRIARRI